jgi:hypothetical protein
VRRQAAHRVEGHRIAADGVVLATPGVGPGDGQLDALVARGDAHLVRQPADGLGRYAGDARGPLGRVVLDPLLQQLEGGLDRRAVGQPELAQQERVGSGRMAEHRLATQAVPPQLVLRVVAGLFLRHLGAHEHAELVARRVLVDQLAAVGVAGDELAVVQALGQQLVDHRQQEGAVGAGADRHPLVGDRRVSGAHRVDRDEAPAVALELGDRDLQRVAVVVLGRPEHHEQPRAVEVGAAELPERAAYRVDQAGRHVDRAEAAMGGVVRGAELAREQAGQRLHLVAPGEQRELLRVRGTDPCQPLGQRRKGLLPFDFDEVAIAARRAFAALERPGQPRGRVLLHDPRAALGADHALVQRVVGVAVDVADLAVAQVHADAAAAGAHVAGRVARLPRGARIRVGQGIVQGDVRHESLWVVVSDAAPAAGTQPPGPRRASRRARLGAAADGSVHSLDGVRATTHPGYSRRRALVSRSLLRPRGAAGRPGEFRARTRRAAGRHVPLGGHGPPGPAPPAARSADDRRALYRLRPLRGRLRTPCAEPAGLRLGQGRGAARPPGLHWLQPVCGGVPVRRDPHAAPHVGSLSCAARRDTPPPAPGRGPPRVRRRRCSRRRTTPAARAGRACASPRGCRGGARRRARPRSPRARWRCSRTRASPGPGRRPASACRCDRSG